MNKDLLKLSNLSKEFLTANSKIKILKKINIKVSYGKIIALVGPSGSGKSTLLHLIGQLDTATSGDIFFENLVFCVICLPQALENLDFFNFNSF